LDEIANLLDQVDLIIEFVIFLIGRALVSSSLPWGPLARLKVPIATPRDSTRSPRREEVVLVQVPIGSLTFIGMVCHLVCHHNNTYHSVTTRPCQSDISNSGKITATLNILLSFSVIDRAQIFKFLPLLSPSHVISDFHGKPC
jgi:hypothetical protein